MKPLAAALIKRLPSGQGLLLPSYQTPHAAGLDLIASENLLLEPGKRGSVGTGLSIALPVGYEAQIRPRSGLALKFGVTLLNSPGTIDADYRGEIRLILINFGEDPFDVQRGDRIAQMIVAPVARVEWEEVIDAELPISIRGKGGFGSTGRS